MDNILVTGWNKPLTYTPSYDTSHFVNTGAFFDTHPGVTPNVTRYERTDMSGKLVESWERNKNGVMVNVTKRDALIAQTIEAEEALNKLKEARHAT